MKVLREATKLNKRKTTKNIHLTSRREKLAE